MDLDALENVYRAFFTENTAGKHYLSQALEVLDTNINKAMSDNSLDYLSRAKGNREIIDLIDNVLKTKGEPKK